MGRCGAGWFWIPVAFGLSHGLMGCGNPCDGSGLSAGQVEARVDGESWTGDGAAWLWTGDGIQITTAQADDWRLTLVGQTTQEGETLAAVAESGGFPVDVDLSSDGGGFGLVYPESGNSYSSNNSSKGGWLTFLEIDDSSVTACFDFEAEAADGSQLTVTRGVVYAEGD